jgi:hypothetical protein
MTDRKPVLQMYGPLHALSSRGLHVRQSSRAWKLVRPMAPELLAIVHSVCERLTPADAARLLCLLDPRLQSDNAPAEGLPHPVLRDVLRHVASMTASNDAPAPTCESAGAAPSFAFGSRSPASQC